MKKAENPLDFLLSVTLNLVDRDFLLARYIFPIQNSQHKLRIQARRNLARNLDIAMPKVISI